MPTTLTATPDFGTASVVLKVVMTNTDLPITKYSLTRANYAADVANWTGVGSAFAWTSAYFGFTNTTGALFGRTLTGLTIGRTYEVRMLTQGTATGTGFGVTGGPSVTYAETDVPLERSVTFVATATSHQIYVKGALDGPASYYSPAIVSLSLVLLPTAYSGSGFALTRTDANGTRPVRLMPGQRVIDGGLIAEDFEAALTGPISYSFTSPTGSQVTTSTALNLDTSTLAPAVYPQYGIKDVFVTGYSASRPTETVTHEVIGRSDSVSRLQPLKTRRGTLTIWCADYAGIANVLDVYRRGEIVVLRQPDHRGLDMYHIATGVNESGYDPEFKRWRLDVDFLEVRYPNAPLLGTLGWSYNDLAAVFATYDQLNAYFATYNALQIGPS